MFKSTFKIFIAIAVVVLTSTVVSSCKSHDVCPAYTNNPIDNNNF